MQIPPLSYRKQKHLTTADIPDGTTSIGDAAFSLCPLLRQVTIPASVEHIGVAAFCGSGVEEVLFKGIPKDIEPSVFAGCKRLRRIIVPKGSKDYFTKFFESSLIHEETESQKSDNKTQYTPQPGRILKQLNLFNNGETIVEQPNLFSQLSPVTLKSQSIQTTSMNTNEILSALKDDYVLRSGLRKKNFAIQEELENDIDNLEKQYIASSIIPQLEAYAKELLKDLECEVYLAVKKDINGNVSVDNELVSWEDVHATTEEDNTPNVVQEPVDDTIGNESSQDENEGNDTPRSTRGGRKKFKVILNPSLIPHNYF